MMANKLQNYGKVHVKLQYLLYNLLKTIVRLCVKLQGKLI